jgi:fumarate hydratase subunit beta
MDAYTPRLLAEGLRAMIGKGERSAAVREAVRQYRAIYFIAIGGAGALLSRSIKKAEVIAYDDLGTEAIRRLTVERFPAIVADDVYGADIFEQGKASYRREAR